MSKPRATRPPRLGEARPQELDPSWRLSGACADLAADSFYPEGGQRQVRLAYDRAREICMQCPMIERCLEYALEHEERHGMWGGATPAEREEMLRARRRRSA